MERKTKLKCWAIEVLEKERDHAYQTGYHVSAYIQSAIRIVYGIFSQRGLQAQSSRAASVCYNDLGMFSDLFDILHPITCSFLVHLACHSVFKGDFDFVTKLRTDLFQREPSSLK